ncbi:type II toxin-antitoxin system VapC family toxin [Candidatus Poribacteria bacterium]|nr:type II toxin-antitoxin system VapC family toxin [Candidatus Poribacteria bacterium]
MEYLADTVAIIRHFARTGVIGKKAKQILRDADAGKNTIYISVISLVEILYLAERNKIPINFEEVKRRLNESDNYQVIDLSLDIVEVAKTIQCLELHDRLIVATGKYLAIPILTSDLPISNSNLIDVIWK